MIRGQVLREVWEITEWKDGAVYRTKFVARVWVWIDSPEAKMRTVDGMIYTSTSTKYDGPTIRSVVVPDPK